MYTYNCTIVRVVDGDTIDVDIDLGFGVWLRNERIRLAGIDTPESRTVDLVEKQFGKFATAYVEKLLPVGSKHILQTSSYDPVGKFGRILGDFIINDESLVYRMLRDNIGVAYFGQNKEDVVQAHLTNRQRLIESGKITLDE